MKRAIRQSCFLSIFASVVILGACQTAPKPDWELPSGVKSLSANGYPISYFERGSGPTVVLVHGSLNDYRYWTPQIESLSSRFRIVSISLRHYYPELWKGQGEFSLKLHAEDLTAFIERLAVGPVFVVGWSRGGTVAVDVARSRPDLIRKLVLMDPALEALLPVPDGAPIEDTRVVRARATEVYLKKGEIDAGLQYFFDSSNGAGAWNRLPEEQRRNRRDNAWTIIGQLGDVETVTCADLAQFKMPVLLMGGEQSPARHNRIRAAIQKCLPSAS